MEETAGPETERGGKSGEQQEKRIGGHARAFREHMPEVRHDDETEDRARGDEIGFHEVGGGVTMPNASDGMVRTTTGSYSIFVSVSWILTVKTLRTE